MNAAALWPALPYPAWRDTAATLQLWTQIVGKVRLTLTPWLNHGWQVPLYVTARGLGTSPIPVGSEILEIEFDFIGHRLVARTSRGEERTLPLEPQTVADFYRRVMDLLRRPRRRGRDQRDAERGARTRSASRRTDVHAAYDAAAAHRFWRALVQADRVFKLFRTGFLGKASPVHFFWGSFDLAVTRFSGRPAPLPSRRRARAARRGHARGLFARGQQRRLLAGQRRLPARRVLLLRLSRAGGLPRPPGDAGRRASSRRSASSSCPTTPSGRRRIRTRCCSISSPTTYAAAADAGHWDRAALECPLGVPGQPRPV